jgi:hypothetical protein
MYTVGYSEASAMNKAIAHVTQGSDTTPRTIGKGYTLYERMEGKKAHTVYEVFSQSAKRYRDGRGGTG